MQQGRGGWLGIYGGTPKTPYAPGTETAITTDISIGMLQTEILLLRDEDSPDMLPRLTELLCIPILSPL